MRCSRGGGGCLTKATNAVRHTHPSTIQPTPIHPLNIQFMLAPPIGKVIGKKSNRNPAKCQVEIQGNWYFFSRQAGPKCVSLEPIWGYFRCSRQGKVSSLSSLLSLTLSWSTEYAIRKSIWESITARAQFFINILQTDEEKNISTRCKSNRQIESLIVAAQNSIKRCIGLIGANGMQGVGLSMFSQVPQQLPFYFFKF